ncbi:alcohol oxidase [Coprinopsis marcescibilis]|uniref:pyranose dehydrogenase (acceptor) n=1 Tax=Coprinopsis marcescibilis TaxID=230819 RepID=A0A5C3L523_COPMA|nr:alcohol oxidase [Coprinopsis marcescibilis]
MATIGGSTLSAFAMNTKARLGNNRLTWLTVVAVSILLKRALKARSRTKLIADARQVAREVKEDLEFDEYDIIIIGGGTAGCVLAARLSEDPSLRVLLLEAGQSGRTLKETRIPVAYSLLFRTKHVHQLYTEAQDSANGKRKFWPRAKMLGGCSSINAQMAQIGAPADFDRWGDIIDDDAWKWHNLQRYFRKYEKYVPHPEFPDVDLSVKGKDGPVEIGYFSEVSEGSKLFIKACQRVGIPYSPDFNTSKGTLGVNKVMTFIDEKGTRVSSESAYLTHEVLARPNLKVVVNATVTKIITEKVGDKVKAVGAEFAKSQNGTRYRVKSRREVIVSAGAVHSPHILLLSGIGPAAELEKHNIPVALDLPGVGDNLVDHPVVDLYYKNRYKDSPLHVKPKSIPDVFRLIASTLQYQILRTGALATNFGESAAFVRSDDRKLFSESDYPDKLNDTTSADNSPDLEIFTTPMAYKDHGDFTFPMHTFAVHAVLLRPKSKGTLTLRSASPWDAPVLNPNYLKEPEDLQKLVRGVRLITKIAKEEPLASRLDLGDKEALLDSDTHLKTDEELAELIKERVETLYHPTTTCKMAPLEQGGVVDSHLRVYGVKGLRVCDASIFPEIVSGHTAAAVLASAEHLADIIRSELRNA